MGETTYSITNLAREFDITTRAIRFYEDQGLLNPDRSKHRRVYSKRDRVRLKLILRGKRLGFTLSETRELFDLYDVGATGETAQLERYINFLDQRRVRLEQQKKDIEAVLQEIDTAREQCLCSLEKNKSNQEAVK